MLSKDEWIWQYQELYPDQLRVVKDSDKTEEIYSPQVAVKDWEWTACEQSTIAHGAVVNKAQQSVMNKQLIYRSNE